MKYVKNRLTACNFKFFILLEQLYYTFILLQGNLVDKFVLSKKRIRKCTKSNWKLYNSAM